MYILVGTNMSNCGFDEVIFISYGTEEEMENTLDAIKATQVELKNKIEEIENHYSDLMCGSEYCGDFFDIGEIQNEMSLTCKPLIDALNEISFDDIRVKKIEKLCI